MYRLLCHNPNLKMGTGIPVVIVGWTNLEKIKIDSSSYACLGNLYSPTRGISHLIRNLLFNPSYNLLCLMGVTKQDKNSGSIKCLTDFLRNGIKGVTDDGKYHIIDSDIEGYIDSVIPYEHLEKLRNRIIYLECDSIYQLNMRCDYLNINHQILEGLQPMTYPETEIVTTTYPSEINGHSVVADKIPDAWVLVLQRIRKYGQIIENSYGTPWQELIDLKIVTDDSLDDKFPDYIPFNKLFIDNYCNEMISGEISPSVKYTYGSRLRNWFGDDQIKILIKKLIDNPKSTSAVMNLWDIEDNLGNGSPCLTNIWCRISEGKMSLTAVFRSNDMFGAWIANAYGLRVLQNHIIDRINQESELNLKTGKLITISQSAHIYNDCWERADKVINNHYHRLAKNNFLDPIGSFVISTEGTFIIVNHISPNSGLPLGDYKGVNIVKLISNIIEDNPAIQPSHSAYLMRELMKAQASINTGGEYIQDS